MIELASDGTGLVRLRQNGTPVAFLTSSMSGRITKASRDLIERLAGEAAEEAAKSPASSLPVVETGA